MVGHDDLLPGSDSVHIPTETIFEISDTNLGTRCGYNHLSIIALFTFLQLRPAPMSSVAAVALGEGVQRRHVLTIDLGTSGPKAAVVDEDGRVVGSARGHVDMHFTPDGGAEQSPDQLWSTTVEACAAAVAAADVPAGSICAVATTSQYSSIVPCDRADQPVGNLLTWMDQRGTPKALRKLKGYPRIGDSPVALLRWLRVHGLPPIEGGMSLTHMRWIRYARPEIYARTATFLEPGDYLNLRFTGRATANQCSAYMMLLNDNRTVAAGWDPTLIRQSFIDRDRLPEFVPVGSVIGTVLPDVARAIGLGSNVPVLASINDTQAGAVAAGAFAGTHAGLSMGTTSVMIAHAAAKKTDPFHTLFTMPSPIGDRPLLSAENGAAGVTVDYFLDQVVYPDDAFSTGATPTLDDRYAAFAAAAAASGPGANGVLFLPWLRGSLAPAADSRMRGGFLNVGLDTTRHDLARAVFEGVAHNLRWMRGPVEKFLDRELSHFVYYGGGARSTLWCQIMADVLGSPIHQLADPGYANSVGTARFAFHHLGMIDAHDTAAAPVAEIFEPDPRQRARYDERSEVFGNAYGRVKPLTRRLNRRP